MIDKFIPSTMKRVARHTCDNINAQIRADAVSRLEDNQDQDEEKTAARIKELNSEWDTERVIETHLASMVILGSIIGYKDKKSLWFLITGAMGGFLLQHALQGFCPSLPIMRWLGVRTSEEINHEKTALKVMRGDFSQKTDETEQIFKMTEKE